jgi:hypothetical protein
LVTFFFPKGTQERELLASYQRQDNARADMAPAAPAASGTQA